MSDDDVDVLLENTLPICPICITSFNGPLELLKHVYHKHVPSKPPCLKCEETCQHVINEAVNPSNEPCIKIDPNDGFDETEKSLVWDLIDETTENVKNEETEKSGQKTSFLTIRSDLFDPLQNQNTKNQAIQTPYEDGFADEKSSNANEETLAKKRTKPNPKQRKKIKMMKMSKRCGYCDKSYATENELKSHWETVHRQQKSSQSRRPEPHEQSRQLHQKPTNHENVDYKCDYCTKEFPSKAQVEFHMKKMNDQAKLYSCSKSNCSFTAHYLCVWNDHRMIVHRNEEVKAVVQGLPLQNQVINQQIESQAILQAWNAFRTPFEMIQEYSGDETEPECMEIHQCDLCDTFFNSKNQLSVHKKGGHMCEFCNFIYWTVEGKENHLKICTDQTLNCDPMPQNVIPVSALNDENAEDIVVIDPKEDVNSQEVNENVDSSNVTITLDSEKAVTQPQTVNRDKIHNVTFNTNAKVNSRSNTHVDFNKVKCDLCDAIFHSTDEFNAHDQLYVHKKAGHKCEFCNIIYKTVKQKENHLKLAHSFKCPLCDLSFVSKKQRKSHLHLVSHNLPQNVMNVMCALNDEEAEDIAVIDPEKDVNSQEITLDSDKEIANTKENSQPNSQIKKFVCGLCDTFFNSNDELNAHYKERHKCEFCNFHYSSVKAKENHMKSTHSFKCPKCDLSFVSKNLCRVHTLNCDPVIKCDLCDASFTYKQLVVHKKAGHKCEFCNAIYKSVKAKENHLKKSHSFKCPKCDVTFVSKELLSDHLVSHVNHSFLLEGSHKCAICKLRFSTKMDLQKHKVESHKFSKCEFCDYATKFKSNLKVHKKNFHDEKSKKRKPENLQAKNKKRKPETLHIPSNKPSKKRKVKN